MPLAGRNDAAFTFLEALIALALVALIAAVLVTAHVHAVRTEEGAQWLARARLQAERIFTGNRLELTPGSNVAGWIISSSSIPPGDEQSDDLWLRWEIAPSNHPALKTVLLLRQR